MGRYLVAGESQLAILSGLPVTTTVNGWIGCMNSGNLANFKLRRVHLGVRAGVGAATSQQLTVAVFRQTVRPLTSGFSTTVPINMDPRGRTSGLIGLDMSTGTTFGTGPTITAGALQEFTFNTQSGYDIPYEMLEEWIVDQGTSASLAPGLAFVNMGNSLPTSHLYTIDIEEEE